MQTTNASITQWLNAAGRKPPLPRHRFDEIAKEIQSMDESDPRRVKLINKLVEHNLKLVVMFVNRFMHSKGAKRWGSEETLDYLQVGAIGLRRAVEKYDPTRGYCFSTYAQHWIRSFVGRYNYREMSPINIPENSARAAFSYLKHGKAVDNSGFAPHTAKELTALVMQATRIDSLDRSIGEGISLMEAVKDSMIAPEHVNHSGFSMEMEIMIEKANLKERDIAILHYRYLEGWTLAEIAEFFELNSTTVSKILHSSQKRLKSVAGLDKVAA